MFEERARSSSVTTTVLTSFQLGSQQTKPQDASHPPDHLSLAIKHILGSLAGMYEMLAVRCQHTEKGS